MTACTARAGSGESDRPKPAVVTTARASAARPVRRRSAVRPLSHIGREAVAEGPVGLVVGADDDLHVLAADDGIGDELVDDGSVEALLLAGFAPIVGDDVDDDNPVRPMDAEIGGVVDDLARPALVDDLEAVVLGDAVGLDERRVDAVGNAADLFGRAAPEERDADERHGRLQKCFLEPISIPGMIDQLFGSLERTIRIK